MIPGNGVGGVGRRAARDRLARRLRRLRGARRGGRPRALIDVPDGMALDDAVALLADGRTATMLADAAAVAAGERVLVLAAAGGVGTLLVQLARRGGRDRRRRGRQRGQARRGRRRSAPRRCSTRTPPGRSTWSSTASAARSPARRSRSSRRGGRMLSYGLASGTWAGISPRRPRRAASRSSSPTATRRRCAATPSARWPAGSTPVIGQRFPLERAADAHAAIEARATTGKTLLEVRDS